MRLLAILLLAAMSGCTPKTGERRVFLFYDAHGRAHRVDVTVHESMRVPVLDRNQLFHENE